jgi:hypothetical protein
MDDHAYLGCEYYQQHQLNIVETQDLGTKHSNQVYLLKIQSFNFHFMLNDFIDLIFII